MALKDALRFRLSPKELYFESWQKARNFPYPYRFFIGQDECLFCGKKEDYLFGFVTLTPMYLGDILGVKYICNSHKGEWWNCITGEKAIHPGKSKLLSLFHQIILGIVIPTRIIWFFLYDGFMWYVAIYFWYLWRKIRDEK